MIARANELAVTAGQTLSEPTISDLLGYDFALLGASTAGLAGFLVILTAVLRATLARFDISLDGIYAYLTPMILGAIAGVVVQYTTGILDPAYVDIAKPMGGIVFGISAGFTAIVFHQGGKQSKETRLRTAAAQIRR